MPKKPRPKGLPKKIPAWAWKALKVPGQHLPHRKPAWFWTWRAWRLGAKTIPPVKPPKPKPAPLTKTEELVAFCHQALGFAGQMHYTQTAARSQLFHRKPGNFKGAYADCSQFVSAILHWVGVKSVTDTDATGSLLEKGTEVTAAAVARVVIFGPGAGVHAGIITGKTGSDWWVVAFGHETAPDRVKLSILKTYFAERGEPGVRFRDFL